NAIDSILIEKRTSNRRGSGNKTRLWENLSNAVNSLPSKDYPHSIPSNYRRLQSTFKEYKVSKYDSLVHGGIDNDNRTKRTPEINDYLLAKFCLSNKMTVPDLQRMYDAERTKKGWPSLSEQAIANFLNEPQNMRIWTLARDGKDAYTNLFGHKIRRDKSDWFPNAYWAVDGSKLDWVHYYDNETGMAAKLKINPVIDVFSEVILGYSFSTSEKTADHFRGFKSAMNFALKRPFKVTYDNQSGHKSARMQELYNNIIAQGTEQNPNLRGVHYPTRPYHKSNPAEQIFNRLQQQEINKFWFSDKQGVRVKMMKNVANLDFIKEHKEHLMSMEDLLKAWKLVVARWNTSKHPHFQTKTRLEVYATPAPFEEKVHELDLINIFWINESKPITYKRDGLTIKIDGKAYMFEVYNDDGSIETAGFL
ncbi:MAG: hypothetical protein EBS86_15800, partial [Crocinitomicaceae bacterium]|nr:hypothetical protein [Crocinitomicaceae bacterium]